MSAAYVDASALVKLFKPEPETEALMDALVSWDVHVSSELIVVEALCTAKRLGGPVDRAAAALDGLGLVPFSEAIRNQAAARAFDPPLRALDAIHLATALSLGGDVDAFIAYDTGLSGAADASGLRALAPGSSTG